MSKVDYSGVPEAGSKWEFEGEVVTVDRFKAKGRGGYVIWSAGNSTGNSTKLSEFKRKAKAA